MNICQDTILSHLDKPIAILGDGLTGQSLQRLVAHIGGSSVIYSEEENGKILNEHAASQHDVFLFSPGFASGHPWLDMVRSQEKLLLSELDFGSLFWKGKIIAITGTNGKTTITDFIDQVLSAEGHLSKAVGNIGKPFTDIIPIFNKESEWAVCEVSSFQAEPLQQFVADYVVWTNLTEDHQDRHGSMAAYFECKWRLVEQCRGISFLGEEVYQMAVAAGKDLPASIRCVKFDQFAEPPANSPFALPPQKKNFQIATAMLLEFGVSEVSIANIAGSFRLPKHRLSKVAEIEGVSFWNDSKATNFGAALAAVESFDQPVHWIGGGVSKGGDVRQFCSEITSGISTAYLIGNTAAELSLHLTEFGVSNITYHALNDAVKAAFSNAVKGDSILLSPGFASFDMFENYAVRGDEFIKAVEEIRSVKSKI